jgi:acetylornithine deacetylase/succinyl-diaminopimelate desuccinylase-like protein
MDALLTYLDTNQARFRDELCTYLRFPSVSAQPKHKADLQACAEWLRAHCQSLGLDAALHPTEGNPVLVARTPRTRGARQPHYLVYGHYDVQPPEPLELWKSPPFEPRVEGRNVSENGYGAALRSDLHN